MNRSRTHVITVGNEKGGSGKSTLAFHLAIGLLHRGFSVATIDADSRQQTLTRWVRNRRAYADRLPQGLLESAHYHLPLNRADSARSGQATDLANFQRAVVAAEAEVDVIVIDTPGFNTHLNRLAHSIADTLLTPVNDSLVDLDVVGRVDPRTGEPSATSPYGRLVQRARRSRAAADGGVIDWVIVRNRIAMLESRNMGRVQDALRSLSQHLDCRVADGIGERVIYRSLFDAGLTVFDLAAGMDLAGPPSVSEQNAVAECLALIAALDLPSTRDVSRTVVPAGTVPA